MEQRLNKIQQAITKLQELHQSALNENIVLRENNNTLKDKLLVCENEKASLAKQNVVDGIVGKTAVDDVEKKQMKLRINELVREVDKCIALLNQ